MRWTLEIHAVKADEPALVGADPEVAVRRHERLFVIGQRRWRDADKDIDVCLRLGHGDCNQESKYEFSKYVVHGFGREGYGPKQGG